MRARIAPVITCAVAFAALMALPNPAAAQECGGEGVNVCGFVWDDVNGDGIQDVDEIGLVGVTLTVSDGTDSFDITTDSNGHYETFLDPGTYTISIAASTIATGEQISPNDVTDDAFDSDGVDDTMGNSVVTVTVVEVYTKLDFDFGLFAPERQQPGTGTPGYWKNHPEAWPVSSITVGGILYTRDEAIYWLGKVGKDKTTTMFSSLVPALLNVMIGNDDSCVATTIAAADKWMATYGPVGNGVAASSPAWSVEGEPLHKQMDAYNNGLLCAPHRN